MNTYGIKPFGAIPSEEQIEHMSLEKKAFFHFGPNTFTNLEWGDGSENASVFNPTSVDTDQWIRTAKEAGFKLAILTVKHHDGFCLWPSAHTEQSIKNSPYKNGRGDIVREFTDSCRKYGMRVGFYFSPWDRNSKYWGKDEYSDYYAAQLTELMTGYGEIDEVWWDGAGSSETVYNWKMWHDIIKKHHPHALMFGSFGATDYVSLRWVGNEAGYAGSTHYASIDAESVRKERTVEMNSGKILGDRYIPAEVDVSIRPGWFYHQSQSDKVKSPRELDNLYFNSIGRNAMLLLNFPPNRDGVVEEIDATRAIESHRRIQKMLERDLASGASVSAESVYCEGTEPENAFSENEEKFYAPCGNCATLHISLPEKRKFNVLLLSEVFENGERIVSFSLKNADTEQLICEGTSVGRKKMVKFKETEAKNLILQVEALATPMLRRFALYSYEAPADIPGYKPQGNLLLEDGARYELIDDKTAIIYFGGIYDYNVVVFATDKQAEFEAFSFDGSKYHSIYRGRTREGGGAYGFKVPTVSGTYQLKLVSSEPFNPTSAFNVHLKEN